MGARIGWTACGVCGNPEAAVSENATGTLSLSCHKCQFSGYAKQGTKAARNIRATMVPDEDAKDPQNKGELLPTSPRQKAPIFNLGNL